MSIPLAAIGAVVAALLETSVLPELTVAGAKPDLVFILALLATLMIGFEDGLAWAFVGGLMLDLLTPSRQLGATSLTLLFVVGAGSIAGRLLPARRIPVAVLAVFVLGWLYQWLMAFVLGFSAGVTTLPSPAAVAPAVVFDTILAVPFAAGALVLWRRFGQPERMEW